MDLLVMRERPRKGIRNSGYDVSDANLLCWTVSALIRAAVSAFQLETEKYRSAAWIIKYRISVWLKNT